MPVDGVNAGLVERHLGVIVRGHAQNCALHRACQDEDLPENALLLVGYGLPVVGMPDPFWRLRGKGWPEHDGQAEDDKREAILETHVS